MPKLSSEAQHEWRVGWPAVCALFCALLFATLGAYPTIEAGDGSSDLTEPRGTPEVREPAGAPRTTLHGAASLSE
jgi:hypothetical protein